MSKVKADKATPKPPPVAKAGRRGCLFNLGSAALVGGVFTAAFGLVGGIGLWAGYQEYVVRDPGPHLAREAILGVIADESNVYYSDGVTRVGVFFEDEHRRYVPWEEIPPAWPVAIVAAEDGKFWSHPGFDWYHIARAMKDNVTHGRMMAGGSTLTQQTAKNLFYRPDRSLKSKLTELVNALRLEAHYSKADILTFYANQFHVTGNGRGLGIAARHFFDKDVKDLSFVECAFLAGLVKGPAAYDPFLGDESRRQRALDKAQARTRYVLGRIIEEPVENLAGPRPDPAVPGSQADWDKRVAAVGTLKQEARDALDKGFTLDFKRGTFRYDSSALLDEIARRLAEAPFDAVLKNAGIADPAKAGLVVVTTLDADLQRESTYGMWHHLTEIGTWLEARTAADFILGEDRAPHFDPDVLPKVHEFRTAKVTALKDKRQGLVIDLGGHVCEVPRDGLVRAAVAVLRGQKKSKSAKAGTAEVDAFADHFKVGSVVWASIRSEDDKGRVCDLEVRPELQGALVVLDHGQVRAMVAGNDNRNFNRATALRQMGSTWKPLIYHSALQLGWQPDDLVDNRRGVFPFSTTFYWPRPDHNPTPEMALAWAGVNSENLASVWLLYHLTDRLGPDGIAQLAVAAGMARRSDESAKDYQKRVQKLGILPTKGRVEEGWFAQSKVDTLGSAAMEAHPEDRLALVALSYGWGFGSEEKRAGKDAKNRGWKADALGHRWTRLDGLLDPCSAQVSALVEGVATHQRPAAASIADIRVRETEEGLDLACFGEPEGYVAVGPEFDRWFVAPEAAEVPTEEPENNGWFGLFKPKPAEGAEEPEEGATPGRPDFGSLSDVLVDGRLHLGTLASIRQGIQRREAAAELAEGDVDLYSPEVLYWHQDFRTLLGIRYVKALAEQFGVQTDINEVLSMPLGASEVTLEEMTSVYSGITSGQRWRFPGMTPYGPVDETAAATLLIAEIRDVDGNVLYRARPESQEVTSPATAAVTADILRNVVRFGTGTRAEGAVKHGEGAVPLVGKTGTTNHFKNAAFVGVAPKWDSWGGGYSVPEGYVVGAYVGYDDNRPMRSGGISIAGASGALPAWITACGALEKAGLLGDPQGSPATPPSWPLMAPSELVRRPVDELGRPGDPSALGDANSRSILVVPQAEVPDEGAVAHSWRPRRIRVAWSTRQADDAAKARREALRALDGGGGVWSGTPDAPAAPAPEPPPETAANEEPFEGGGEELPVEVVPEPGSPEVVEPDGQPAPEVPDVELPEALPEPEVPVEEPEDVPAEPPVEIIVPD